MNPTSANFAFLKRYGEQLHRLAALGEGYFRTAPNTTLIKLRQFAELLAQEVAARSGVLPPRLSALLERIRHGGVMTGPRHGRRPKTA